MDVCRHTYPQVMFPCDTEDSSCARRKNLACVRWVVQAKRLSSVPFQNPIVSIAQQVEKEGRWRRHKPLWLAVCLAVRTAWEKEQSPSRQSSRIIPWDVGLQGDGRDAEGLCRHSRRFRPGQIEVQADIVVNFTPVKSALQSHCTGKCSAIWIKYIFIIIITK